LAKVLIVDGHAYAYRAFYAIRSLNSPSGQPTNAIFGFIKMLAKMRAAVQPTHWIVVWDGGLSRERQEALPEYKAQRPEMPDALETQLSEIGKFLSAANIASYCEPGVEADDYIAFVAAQAAELKWEVVIASSDKDFMQLVRPGIGLLNPNDKSEQIWGPEQVVAKTGVRPEQVVDWLSLLGDAVDNIPGVSGVGPKTAADLLRQFGTIEAMYQRIEEVKSARVKAALQAAVGDVNRNQKLVRLKPEVGKEFLPVQLAVRPEDLGKLTELYREWGFRSLLAEALARAPRQPELI